MMRVLFFVLSVFAFNAFAQTPFVNQTFEATTRAAEKEQYEQAIEKYRTTILYAEGEHLSDEYLARIHFNIGACYYQLKNSAKAAQEFAEAIKLSKRTYRKAFYALGMAHSDLKNWHAAETAFREVIKLKRDDGEAWFDLALVLLEEKDYDEAEKAFYNAVKYKSIASSDAHNNLGAIFALESDFSAAESEFKTALVESKGKSIEAKNNLEFCRLYKRNFKENLLAKFEFSKTRKK